MDQLSRNLHLWIEYFNQTKGAPRPPLVLEQMGTAEFERALCRTDVLKKIWSDCCALQATPRFWRSAASTLKMGRGSTVGISGEYIIFERFQMHKRRHTYTWVSIHDQDESAVFSYEITLEINMPVKCYMDPGTDTFYVVTIKTPSL